MILLSVVISSYCSYVDLVGFIRLSMRKVVFEKLSHTPYIIRDNYYSSE